MQTTSLGMIACVLGCGLACAVSAQSYPTKPVRLIVGSSPGGGGDTFARVAAQGLTHVIGQQIIIDNRAGASGNIGADLVAKAPPDGYTLLFVFTGHVLNPGLHSKLPFDTVRDFAPVSLLATNESVLVVHPSVPAKSLTELIALVKNNPGKYSMGALTSSAQHLGTELFRLKAGIDFLFIPYKGNGPALTDLLGGQINMAFNTVAITLPLVQAGKLRALAVAGERRSKLVPDLPTMSEAGLPGFSFFGWYGIVAPARTPDAIVRRLHQGLVQAMKSPDIVERVAAMGNEPVGSTPAEFDKFIRDEIPKWAKVIKEAKISLGP
ncbi:MAG: tripartite tricarboxylate transporter substrate binding protein [Burkholderiales bacterium]